MKTIIYKNKYFNKLGLLLCDYFKETLKDNYRGTLEIALSYISTIVDNKYMIYLVVNDEDEVVGFTTLYIHTMNGFMKRQLVIDHMYVIPEYRRTKATMWLYATIGNVMDKLQLPSIGTTFVDSANKGNNRLVGGKVIAEVTTFNIDSVKSKFNKYMKGLRCL